MLTHVAARKRAPSPSLRNKNSKKREIPQKSFKFRNGTFTPLIVGTNGGMGTESQLFLKNLANGFF